MASTEEELMLYIVNSGDGYFVRFDSNTPLLDTDPLCATRMEEEQAKKTIEQLEALGFAGELVGLRFARLKRGGPYYYRHPLVGPVIRFA